MRSNRSLLSLVETPGVIVRQMVLGDNTEKCYRDVANAEHKAMVMDKGIVITRLATRWSYVEMCNGFCTGGKTRDGYNLDGWCKKYAQALNAMEGLPSGMSVDLVKIKYKGGTDTAKCDGKDVPATVCARIIWTDKGGKVVDSHTVSPQLVSSAKGSAKKLFGDNFDLTKLNLKQFDKIGSPSDMRECLRDINNKRTYAKPDPSRKPVKESDVQKEKRLLDNAINALARAAQTVANKTDLIVIVKIGKTSATYNRA